MSETIHVTNRDELLAALRSATGGETILLAPEDYGRVDLNAWRSFVAFPETVTIASADPENPAVLSGLTTWGAQNVVFDGLKIKYDFNPADPGATFLHIVNSQNCTIKNSIIEGDIAEGYSPDYDGYPIGLGMMVRESSGITIENNEIFHFQGGMGFLDNSNTSVVHNNVHSIRMDGINVGKNNQGFLIEGNHFHSFMRKVDSADHADFIQFWTVHATIPTSDVVIRGNVLDAAAGGYTQSIFIRNEIVDMGKAGSELFYRNFLIEDNIIYNSHLHGITVGEIDGLTIRHNAVLHADPDVLPGTDVNAVRIPLINVKENSTNVTIEGNVTSRVSGWSEQPGWTVRDNVFVQFQDPQAPGYYGDVFVSSTLGLGEDGRHEFVALPGGPLDRPELGVASLVPADSAAVAGQFNMRIDSDNVTVRHFDATVGAEAAPDGSVFRWSFGDGISAVGPVVSHAFPDGGYFDVLLTVELPDGGRLDSGVKVGVPGKEVLSLAADGFRSFRFGEETAALTGDFSEGLILGEPDAAAVAPSFLGTFFRSESFEIGFSMQAAHEGAVGEIFRVHGSFSARVTSSGELLFGVGGVGTVTTSGANMRSLGERDVLIQFEDGALRVLVDGVVRGEAAASGQMTVLGGHGLVFGHPWGGTPFPGKLTAFEINIDATDYEEAKSIWQEASDAMASMPPAEDPGEVIPDAIEPEAVEPESDGSPRDDGTVEDIDVSGPGDESAETDEPGEEEGPADPGIENDGDAPADLPDAEVPVEEPLDVEHDTVPDAELDTPLPAEEAPVLPVFSGQVLNRAGLGLGDAMVTFSPDVGAQVETISDGLGGFGFELDAETPGQIEVARAYGAGDPVVTMQSVIEVLRLSVGMKPTWGEATAFDYIAADFNGDGKVNSADAQHMLRAAAGMSTPFEARWIFVDSEADLSHITRNNVTLPAGPRIEDFGSGAVQVDMVGILVGQVQEF